MKTTLAKCLKQLLNGTEEGINFKVFEIHYLHRTVLNSGRNASEHDI